MKNLEHSFYVQHMLKIHYQFLGLHGGSFYVHERKKAHVWKSDVIIFGLSSYLEIVVMFINTSKQIAQ